MAAARYGEKYNVPTFTYVTNLRIAQVVRLIMALGLAW